MDFLYFVPGGTREVPDALRYAFEQPPVFVAVTGEGPSQTPGMVIAAGTYLKQAHRVGYYPEQQTWRLDPSTKAWVGFYTNEPPTEFELRRSRMVSGHWIELGNGEQWMIPLCRAFVEGANGLRHVEKLPRSMDVDDSGQWVFGDVLPRFRRIWDASKTWYDAFAESLEAAKRDGDYLNVELQGVSIAQAGDWALELIAANYRVGKIEVAILRLIDDDTRPEILNLSIDTPYFMQWAQKKTTAAPATC